MGAREVRVRGCEGVGDDVKKDWMTKSKEKGRRERWIDYLISYLVFLYSYH